MWGLRLTLHDQVPSSLATALSLRHLGRCVQGKDSEAGVKAVPGTPLPLAPGPAGLCDTGEQLEPLPLRAWGPESLCQGHLNGGLPFSL